MQQQAHHLHPQIKRILPSIVLLITIYHASVVCQAQTIAPASTATTNANHKNIDPHRLLRQAFDQCQRNIHNYSCTFTRQERIQGKLSKLQTIKVYFREHPLTIHMTWINNPGRVRRALYQQGKHINRAGQELILVEPAGIIARAIAPSLYTPVRGKKARSAARHTVDQFGFLSILKRIINVNQLAHQYGELDLTFEGPSQFASRPTYRIIRKLPAHSAHHYEIVHLIIELDQQWLVPVSIKTYADSDATKLLGAYTFRDIKISNALPKNAFTFKKNAVAMRKLGVNDD